METAKENMERQNHNCCKIILGVFAGCIASLCVAFGFGNYLLKFDVSNQQNNNDICISNLPIDNSDINENGEIIFCDDFNQDLKSPIFKKSLKKTIKFMKFGENYNQPIPLLAIPPKLKYIQIGSKIINLTNSNNNLIFNQARDVGRYESIKMITNYCKKHNKSSNSYILTLSKTSQLIPTDTYTVKPMQFLVHIGYDKYIGHYHNQCVKFVIYLISKLLIKCNLNIKDHAYPEDPIYINDILDIRPSRLVKPYTYCYNSGSIRPEYIKQCENKLFDCNFTDPVIKRVGILKKSVIERILVANYNEQSDFLDQFQTFVSKYINKSALFP